jgi:ATP-dependent Clp endopeptidase proteolytic subunit ClpP
MIQVDIDSNIKFGKLDELIANVPRSVTVHKFNEEGVTKFIRDLNEARNTKQPVIPIYIDSYGGEVYSLLAMVDVMNQITDVPIATIANGKSMSCGAVLFSQGTEGYRFMGPMATLMIHDVSSGSLGKTEEIKADAHEVDRLNDLIYKLMAKKAGKEDRYFWKIVQDKGRADWFLTPEEAKFHNLANHISVPSFKIKVSYTSEFS